MKYSKAAVNYRKRSKPGVNCGTCHYMHADGSCELVEGFVSRSKVCALWASARRLF